MHISKHFSYQELTHSAKAKELGLANIPNAEELENIRYTAQRLEEVRSFLGDVPIYITSCFRSQKVNQAVGGVKNSAHRFGLAADIRAKGYSARELVEQIIHMSDTGLIEFDQVILEFPERGQYAWVHLGFRRNQAQRSEILTAKKINNKTRYFKGLV